MKRKGFTLVELLIVVAILGALASIMTLSSGSASSRAKASAIISGFKIVRTAAIMYTVDSADTATADYFSETASADYVGAESAKQLANYTVEGTGKNWTATYSFGSAQDVYDAFKVQATELGGFTLSDDDKTASMRIR